MAKNYRKGIPLSAFDDMECCHPNCHAPSMKGIASQVPLCDRHILTVYRATNELLNSKRGIGQEYQLLPMEAEYIPGPCPACGTTGLLVHLANGFVTCKAGDCTYDCHINKFCGDRKTLMAISAADRNVVYYMRLGNRAKIGTSRNLKRRLAEINPEDCMAYELGDRTIEITRHKQFAHLRVSGEWFELADDLVRHVNTLTIT